VLAIYERALKEKFTEANYRDMIQALNRRAQVYIRQGRYGQAEGLYMHAMEISEQLYGPEHSNLAHVIDNLAQMYRTQGREAEAESFHQRSLAIIDRVLRPDSPELAQADLATIKKQYDLYLRRLNYKSALEEARKYEVVAKMRFGISHLNYVTALYMLADVYEAQGRNANQLVNVKPGYAEARYAEAGPFLQRALDIREKLFGAEHPDVATTLYELGWNYFRQGASPNRKRSIDARSPFAKRFSAPIIQILY
jgi:tetratricopeptide (TPR) repeat protein